MWRRERPACPSREPSWLAAIGLFVGVAVAVLAVSLVLAAVNGSGFVACLWGSVVALGTFDWIARRLGWP